MGLDGELTGILREVVQFLECLREVKLPVTLESIRENLLVRSKETLIKFTVERIGRSGSPEAYLNMSAAGPKGLLAALKADSEIQEYVGPEERWPRKQQQDYYETFQNVEAANDNASAKDEGDRARSNDQDMENALMEIYANISATQVKSTCNKCGPLYRKEGKKLFVFEQYRACWVGLIGLHLLIYRSDRDSRPCTVLPIRGYMARAASNAIPRDQRKSEATFEIFRPGSKTFQFIARTPQDMEEWVAKFDELAAVDRNDSKERRKILMNTSTESDASPSDAQESDFKEERYQDVGCLVADKTVPEDAVGVNVVKEDSEATATLPSKEPTPDLANGSPPPLPARIPRKLPSLPVQGSAPSYVCPEEEEDDIYHKIEDLRDSVHCYGNVGKASKVKRGDREELATYDDVSANTKEERTEEKSKKNSDSVAKKSNLREEATYDDASSTISPKEGVTNEQSELESYDDVENLVLTARTTKTQETEKTEKAEVTEEPSKPPQKRSFLDRVRSRRESPKKVEKKAKRKTPTPPPASLQEPSTYDDVSDLTNAQVSKQSAEAEESEYNCPPPPRPIYAKPPPLVEPIEQEEIYDDVSACREKYRSEETCKVEQVPTNLQRTPKKFNHMSSPGRADNAENSVMCENADYSQQSFGDNEHYQTPRAEPTNFRKYLPADQEEELYDDVAILADFTARQKEILGRKDSEDATRTQTGWEKRSRNQFVNGKKSKIIDSTGAETNSRRLSGTEDADDSDEQHGLARMNTFQKLISKMENSFGKASVKIAPSMLLNKTNVTNNA